MKDLSLLCLLTQPYISNFLSLACLCEHILCPFCICSKAMSLMQTAQFVSMLVMLDYTRWIYWVICCESHSPSHVNQRWFRRYKTAVLGLLNKLTCQWYFLSLGDMFQVLNVVINLLLFLAVATCLFVKHGIFIPKLQNFMKFLPTFLCKGHGILCLRRLSH